MPALPNYPSVLRVDHLFDVGTDANALVRWHVSYTGSLPTPANCNAFATAIDALAVTSLIPLMSDSVSLLGIKIVDLTSDTASEGEYLTTHAGTRGSAFLGAGTAALVNMPISRRYRGGKPRSYWPFGVQGDLQTPNTWNSSFLTAVLGGLETYLGGIEGIVEGSTTLGTLVSISYYHGFTAVENPITGRTRDVPLVRTAAITPDVVTGLVPSTKVASQRRRNLQKR